MRTGAIPCLFVLLAIACGDSTATHDVGDSGHGGGPNPSAFLDASRGDHAVSSDDDGAGGIGATDGSPSDGGALDARVSDGGAPDSARMGDAATPSHGQLGVYNGGTTPDVESFESVLPSTKKRGKWSSPAQGRAGLHDWLGVVASA